MKILLFTDLDGTLLDPLTYSAAAASPGLELLRIRKIPLIFCSSKTFAEQACLQKELGIFHPFIVENGSAIVFPSNYFTQPVAGAVKVSSRYEMLALSGARYRKIKAVLKRLHREYGHKIYSYSSVSEAETSAATGLETAAVRRARKRMFSETLLYPPPSEAVRAVLENAGLELVQGGRFLTLQGAGVSKGNAVRILTQLFSEEWGEKPLTLCIGDSPNDASMLAAVDRAWLVQQPGGTWADMQVEGVKLVDAVGPEGFVRLIGELFAG